MAFPRTVPDKEGVTAPPPLHYGTHRPSVHTVDTKVILRAVRHADHEWTTGVPAGAAKGVNQIPLEWLQDSPRVCGRYTEHQSW